MKKLLIFVFILLTWMPAFSQEIQHGKRDDLGQYILDSVKYVMPEYSKGIVVFTNGERSEGMLNISTIRQTLMFISPEGEVLEVKDNDEVSRVTIKGRSFVRHRGLYIELLNMASDVVLAANYRINFLETEKQGAYGKASPTTSVTTISNYSDGGRMIELDQNLTTPFRYKEVPYLYKDGTFYIASKKNFQKCFPDKKKQIESYLKETKVDFEKMEDVRLLFGYIGTI
ncbi:MAG: hypothetical protein PHD11_06345 [Bacteroidales bacterium]|nr:hypothetical protein [Bacteroidales bacterium]MDD4669590.1 hypothetical protein [Bacteroidales bacterium]